jgi:hypothetical protein
VQRAILHRAVIQRDPHADAFERVAELEVGVVRVERCTRAGSSRLSEQLVVLDLHSAAHSSASTASITRGSHGSTWNSRECRLSQAICRFSIAGSSSMLAMRPRCWNSSTVRRMAAASAVLKNWGLSTKPVDRNCATSAADMMAAMTISEAFDAAAYM